MTSSTLGPMLASMDKLDVDLWADRAVRSLIRRCLLAVASECALWARQVKP